MAGDEKSNNDDAVGYRRPPKTTQFKKGQCGNPRGRPRKTPGRRAIAERVFNEIQRLSGQPKGARVRYRTLELVVRTLKYMAASGHQRASALYTRIADGAAPREAADRQRGFIVLPEKLTQEEWEAIYSPKDEPPDWT